MIPPQFIWRQALAVHQSCLHQNHSFGGSLGVASSGTVGINYGTKAGAVMMGVLESVSLGALTAPLIPAALRLVLCGTANTKADPGAEPNFS